MRAATRARLREAVARRAGCERRGPHKDEDEYDSDYVETACVFCGTLIVVMWFSQTPTFRALLGYDESGPVWGDAHLDHLVPESRNGPTSLDNTVLACPPCNLGRGARAVGDPQFVAFVERRRVMVAAQHAEARARARRARA